MVHAPVILPVNGNPDGMDVAAYPIVRLLGGGVVGRLNGAGARNHAHKETGNPDRPDYPGLGLDLEPNLLSERGKKVFTRHARDPPRSSCRP